MFAGLRKAATAKKQRRPVRLKTAPKPENKNYDHFKPISGQASARVDVSTVGAASFFVCHQKPVSKEHARKRFQRDYRLTSSIMNFVSFQNMSLKHLNMWCGGWDLNPRYAGDISREVHLFLLCLCCYRSVTLSQNLGL